MGGSRQGGDVALEWCGLHLTYAQLDEAVAALAESLSAVCETGSPAFVVGPASPGYVVALLAVWRAGAVPVPVDAGLSAGQSHWMASRIRPDVVISNDATPVEHLRGIDSGVAEFVLDAALGTVVVASAGDGSTRQRRKFDDPDTGYVIPTSGSTGEPKAIVGSRAGLSSFLDWFQREFALVASDRCAALTRVNFDPSLREILSILRSAGTVILPPVDVQLDMPALARHVSATRPTVLFLVPSIAARLAAEPALAAGTLDRVRLIFFAGEVLGRQVAGRWSDIAPHAEIVNLYGQTEATLAQLYRRNVQTFIRAGDSAIPVGIPRPGVEVSMSGEGEILLWSQSPALGVLAAPVAARPGVHTVVAVDNPLRTGDSGFRIGTGDWVITGRTRDDIKFGGKRVSYRGFADALEAMPAVRRCVVVDRGGPQAFIELASPEHERHRVTGNAHSLIATLRLPRPVLHFRTVLPLLRSGKVDRRALLESLSNEVDESQCGEATSAGVPQTVLELLHLDSVTAGFADAGISSLEMLDAVTALNRVYGTALSVQQCFGFRDAATLIGAVEVLAANTGDDTGAESAEAYTDLRAAFPLSTRQRAFMWVCMREGNANWCNLSREIKLERSITRRELDRAVGRLLARHDALGLALTEDWQEQTFTDAGDLLPITVVADIADTAGTNAFAAGVQALRTELVSALIDPTAPPPLRIGLVSAARDCSIVLVAHHLFVDGLGMDVLATELHALLSDRAGDLARHPGSYREYCLATVRPDDPPRAAEYWRTLLRGVREVRLPESANADANQGLLHSLPLGAVCSRVVHDLAHTLGISSFAVVMAAFEIAVARTFDLDRLTMVVPSQIRGTAGSAAVGMFMTQLVVRGAGTGSLPGNAVAFAEQIASGTANSEWEFDQRVTELGLGESDGYPLSTVLFNQRPAGRGLRPRDLGAWTPRALGRSLRYQLQGELQTSGPEMVLSYYYRLGLAGQGADLVDRIHSLLLRTVRSGWADVTSAATQAPAASHFHNLSRS
nr:AMP-binding protein [Nocardia nova]